MAALHGDTIETLLWENGFEFQHRQFLYLPDVVEIYTDTFTISIGETWIEEDEWMLDGDYLTYELEQGGEVFDMGYLEGVASEEDLVARIVELAER